MTPSAPTPPGTTDAVWRDADPEVVADHLARVLTRPDAVAAFPGGQSPLPVLEAFSRRARSGRVLSGTVWPTDDRLVPHDHPASNHGLLRRALAGTALKIVPLGEGAKPPRFNLVWLGMGVDGHVASIFPNALEDLAHGRTVVRTRPDPLPPEAPFERLTLTLEALADTREAILVISGQAKRRVLEEALAEARDLPISRFVARLAAPLTVYWNEQ